MRCVINHPHMKWVTFIPPKTRRAVLRAAQADQTPVLISGQTGSGKSGIARWIHANSPRSVHPFIALVAGQDWTQPILSSGSGTLLFPELEVMSDSEKTLLLTLLKTRTLRRVSESGHLRQIVQARVIVPSHEPLTEFSPFEEFFLDFKIHLPPLCQRSEEFEDIATSMMNEISHELRKDHLKGFDRMAWARLKSHSWPGNLRELRNVLRVAILQAQGDRIEATDLPKLGDGRIDFMASREQFEKATIRELLKTFHGKLEETSRILHIDIRALKSKMKTYGIDPEEFTSKRG